VKLTRLGHGIGLRVGRKRELDPIVLGNPIELHPADEPIELTPISDPCAARTGTPIDRQAAVDNDSVQDEVRFEIDTESSSAVDVSQQPVASDTSLSEHIVLGSSRGPLGQIVELIAYLGSRVFGALTLIVALAFLAAYPVLQIFALGYLLEAAGRIGRSGRLRDAFPLVPQASKVGGALFGAWLLTLPWRYLRDVVVDSALIDPLSSQTRFLELGLSVLVFLTPLHILLAILRGGKLRYFFAPLNVVWFLRRIAQGGYFSQAWHHASKLFCEVHVLHYFYLGMRGGLGALAWLAIPSTLYAVGKSGAAGLLGILGGILLTVVVLYVPFLQVHFAAENRFRAVFEVGAVRERFRRAPIAFFIAFLFTLVLVIPLYLLKIEVVPRDALWLPSLAFIITIFPLKIMTGWAYGRAGRKQKHAHWMICVPCRLLMVPVALLYAIVVFFTQYTGWEGTLALYEHHAFLLPVPFSATLFSGQ
jgi:hypothetical protein